MADQKNLAEWLLAQKDRIDFKVSNYSWVEDFAPEYNDYGVTFPGGVIGRAIDKDPELSLTKAIAEAIERATCIHCELPKSTGVAAHINYENAIEGAKRELVERIAFDVHFSNKIPLKKLAPETREAKETQATFSKMGIEFSVYELVSPAEFKVCGIVAHGENYKRPFGGMFGLGCHSEWAHAERSALFEALRNVAYYTKDHDIKSMSIAEFNKIQEPKFLDKFRLALNCEYMRELDFLFSAGKQSIGQFPELIFNSRELLKPQEFEDAPIVVAQVNSNYQFARLNELPSPLG